MSSSADPAAAEPADECEVLDRANLAVYRAKLAEWDDALRGADEHAVWGQIHSMFWDAAMFRTVNELRRIAEEEPRADVGFNGDVQRLLVVGFLTTQVTTIRRLTESQPKQTAKKVISLRAVLEDVTTHRNAITRECYVASHGLPYDVDAALARWVARVGPAQGGTVPGAGPEAWSSADLAHRAFDTLAEVKDSERRRGDLITLPCLQRLAAVLDECEPVCKFTDKFIAHGAHPDNRAGLTPEQRGVSLNSLATCHRAIYRVAQYLSGSVLGLSGVMAVPVPQFDHLANLDKPWMAPGDRRRVGDFWRHTVDEIESWCDPPIWPYGGAVSDGCATGGEEAAT